MAQQTMIERSIPAEVAGDAAIRVEGLTKRFGSTSALDALDLAVPSGVVFGYLGPNGAGKTTTIRLLLGLLRPTLGRATVLGLDAIRQRDEVHRRVGYLPGDFVAYPDMTARDYLGYLADLRGGVDEAELARLIDRFAVVVDRPIGTLSHGNRQKVGLVQAFMHRPDLVVLDEPTGGLDPLVQREFLDLVRETRDDGRTVFLSSHVLDEVDQVADSVAILRQGRLVVVDAVSALRERARRRVHLTFTSDPPVPALLRIDGVDILAVDAARRTVQLTVAGSMAALFRAAASYGIERVVSEEANLDDIFLAYYRDR